MPKNIFNYMYKYSSYFCSLILPYKRRTNCFLTETKAKKTFIKPRLKRDLFIS